MRAAVGGHVAVMECLLKHGADIDARSSVTADMCMLCMKESRAQAMVAWPASYLQHGYTALIEAAHVGKISAVEYLVNHGADVDAKVDVRVHEAVWENTCYGVRYIRMFTPS